MMRLIANSAKKRKEQSPRGYEFDGMRGTAAPT